MTSKGKHVLVTGGSGFIGLNVVNELLKKGYRVNTTTRFLNSESAAPLKGLQKQFTDTLFLFEADLLKPDAYKEAIQGVEAVFHVAAPVLLEKGGSDPEQQLKPAVDGTKNILQSCLETDSVKTIIVTSSGLTIKDSTKNNYAHTEKDFSPHVGPGNDLYIRSKILAEQQVWEFNKLHQDRFRVVTVHPTLVFGPELEVEGVEFKNDRPNAGKNNLLNIINGVDKDLTKGVLNGVDVRDVALGHVKVLECPEATGRILLFAKSLTKTEAAKKILELRPDENFPFDSSISVQKTTVEDFDNTKSKEVLGMTYRSFDQTLKDTLNQIRPRK